MSDITAFVPRLAAELGARDGSHWTSVDGSMLSADISGFTALSEKLAGKGKAGAEEITQLINTCFTALIDAAYDYRGEVIKFGGDALLVLFRGDDHQRRVANASLAMQIALHSSPAAKRANLTMTVGASHGPFDVFVAGSGYRELLIIGPAASNVIHLEGEADKGETLVSPEIAAYVPPERVGRSHAGGLAINGEPFEPGQGPDVRKQAVEGLEAFVPPQVLEQLSAFAELGGEHRIVSVGFVMVTGVAAQLDEVGPEGTAAALGALVDDLIAATGPYGVTALHTDIAGDGLKFVLCAGAPVNPGDTSDALLQAALDIAAIDSPFVLRQGTQTGRVFAGFLGSPYRRTYTLMGDPVNTAARMLGKADDRDIVAVGSMVGDTRTIFSTEELEPFLVKGKTEPIVAHKVRGVTDEVRRGSAATRLYGRRTELDVLSRAIGELGEIVEIVGPAGVGKSRLLDAAWDEAEGLSAFHGTCTPYGATSPYSLFRPLLRGGIGIDLTATADEAGEMLTAIARERAPDLLPWLPLIAVPFGAVVAPTPQVEAIDPEFRRGRMHEAIVDFYDATLGDRPVFMVIEDLHWVDDASSELVDHLIKAAADRPWAGIVTRRPEGSWSIDGDQAHVTTLELGPLTDDDIRELAIETGDRALSDTELDEIARRAGGNPLYAIELTRAVTNHAADDLPESIEGLIATRIDNLDPDARRLVRIASVFGAEFELEQVAAVSGRPLEIGGDVDAMVERIDGDRYRFAHAMYRDVAYEGLPYGRRKALHGAVADHLVATAPDTGAITSLLSQHYSAARRHDQAWRYSLLAGDQARAQHANAEAAAAYTRALESARFTSDGRSSRVAVAEALGDAQFVLARFDEARAAFESARRANTDPLVELRLMRKVGSICERQGRTPHALRWYRRAADAHGDATAAAQLSERAQVVLAQAGIQHRLGDNDECERLALTALADAEQANDASSRALALERIHLALTYRQRPDPLERGEQALAAYRELDDNSGQVRTLVNLGIAAYFAGDWTTASQRYLEATEIGRNAGSVVLAETAALNSAEILADQGRWDQAIQIFTDVRRNWDAVGYPVGVAAASLFLGAAQVSAGLVEDAETTLADARARLEDVGVSELLDDLRTRELQLALTKGIRPAAAAEALLAELGADSALIPRTLRILGVCQALGDQPDSVATLVRSAEVAGEGTYEEALSLMALVELHPDEPDAEKWEHEAKATLRRLDVIATPRTHGTRADAPA